IARSITARPRLAHGAVAYRHFLLLLCRMSASGPGYVKTCLGEGCAELFSQLPSSERKLPAQSTPTSTKSRWKFYTQVRHQSFHTAWVINGPQQGAEPCPLSPQKRT